MNYRVCNEMIQIVDSCHLAACEVHAPALSEGVLELAGRALDAVLLHVKLQTLCLEWYQRRFKRRI